MHINITNMDNHIITILQNFEKPDALFLKDKECLICLETFDLESNNLVQLPCKCSNSTYHIECIVKLINSGENKNFCPHCKSDYEINMPKQVLQYTNQQANNDLQIKSFTNIIIFHILFNSIMNIINIVISKDYADNNNNPEELQVSMLFYFLKLFFNYCILIYSKNNIDKTEDCLVCSYVFQLILFCFLIYSLTKIKNDYKTTFLLLNNIFIGFGDLAYRVIIEHKTRNRIHTNEHA